MLRQKTGLEPVLTGIEFILFQKTGGKMDFSRYISIWSDMFAKPDPERNLNHV